MSGAPSTSDPWARFAHALEALQIDLDITDPAVPVTVPPGLLAAYLAAHDSNRRRT